MPAPFSASSTLPIAALLLSDASRAVFASVVTPPSICGRSGGTDSWASPVTEIVAIGVTCASAGAATRALANVTRMAAGSFIPLLPRHIDVDHQLVLRGLQRIGDVLLDEGVFGL